MPLETLLRALFDARINVVVESGAARVRGNTEGMTQQLVAACKTHRAHLIRLHRPRAAEAEWRRDGLGLADHATRAAWCEVAAGYESQGYLPASAEYLAWLDVSR